MRHKSLLLTSIILVSTLICTSSLYPFAQAQPLDPLDSPLPPPPAPPNVPLNKAQEYLLQKYAIPAQRLVLAGEHDRTYPRLGRTYRAFSFLDTRQRHIYKLMVDISTGMVVEDIESVESEEQDAALAYYGKLEPTLHQRLSTARADDKLTVAIWVAGTPRRSRGQLLAELAAQFPSIAPLLRSGRSYFDLEDRQLAERVHIAYMQMAGADRDELTEPLVAYLRTLGYSVTVFPGMPSFTARLPVQIIRALERRPDVGLIFDIEGILQPLLDTAVTTDRVPAVWQQGFHGDGVSLAIVEPTSIDFSSDSEECSIWSHNCFQHVGESRNFVEPGPFEDHATFVASAAASNHPDYKGVAPGATVHSVRVVSLTASALVSALITALDPVPTGVWARIVNVSAGERTGQNRTWLDRAFDYWALYYHRLVVVAAGNSGHCFGAADPHYLCSPAKAWNVITVGASNDRNTATWDDDSMWSGSSYVNPSGDFEKPEVVAPGEDIRGIGLDGHFVVGSGTSVAAPQVAGLAVLLNSANFQFSSKIPAAKAVVMATAINNVDGPKNIPWDQDLTDGAGSIDAELAVETAQNWLIVGRCYSSCWWEYSYDATDWVPGTYEYFHAAAQGGDRIRAVISWWADVKCPNESQCFADNPPSDFDLLILGPDGHMVADGYSASWNNNYELVDFIAPSTGNYTIGIYRKSTHEESNSIGVAWVVAEKGHQIFLPNSQGITSLR